MSRISSVARTLVVTLPLLAVAGGCASFRTPKTELQQAATPEQKAWFDANRGKARYIPGKGYYVEGTSGYFDDQGRPITSTISSGGHADEFQEDDALPLTKVSKDLSLRWKKLIGKGPNEAVAKSAYEKGESLFRQAKYAEAADQFKVAYERWPDSPQEEDALFKCGESNFFCDHYPKANDAYSRLVKKYPSTTYLDQLVARRFAIARYWQQHNQAEPHWSLTPNLVDNTRPAFDTEGHAMKIYERVRLDDPTGPLADDSIMATANAHFTNQRYNDADYFYTLLRSEYPKSEHQYNAHVLGLRAKLLSYQGPDYDQAPLEEADELAQQLIAQFPTELGDEKQRIVDARGEIRAQRALREYQVGAFYHKNKYYGASRMYFDNVAKAYPETKLAEEARGKIAEVADKPATPTPPLQFLVAWLPEAKTGALGGGGASTGIPTGMPGTPQGVGSMGGIGSGNSPTISR